MTFTTSDIVPVPASGPGALPGFEFTCGCGEVARYSMRTIAADFRRQHVEYHEIQDRIAATRSRRGGRKVVAR